MSKLHLWFCIQRQIFAFYFIFNDQILSVIYILNDEILSYFSPQLLLGMIYVIYFNPSFYIQLQLFFLIFSNSKFCNFMIDTEISEYDPGNKILVTRDIFCFLSLIQWMTRTSSVPFHGRSSGGLVPIGRSFMQIFANLHPSVILSTNFKLKKT